VVSLNRGDEDGVRGIQGVMSEEEDYMLLGRRAEAGFTLLSERLTDGRRAVIVFGDRVSVEVFRVVEELGFDWRMVSDILASWPNSLEPSSRPT
jgi:hypothetical protein